MMRKFTQNSGRFILRAAWVVSVAAAMPGDHDACAAPPARTRRLAEGLNVPVGFAAAPGDTEHIYVVERLGTIAAISVQSGDREPGSLVDLTGRVSLEGDDGLLGLAFDPDYQTNGFFYILYNATDHHIVLARYHCDPGTYVAEIDSAYTIWRYPRPTGHNGGWIGFSPANGLLYITSGDGDLGGTFDAADRAQTIINQPLGKILRIDPRGDDFPLDPDRNYHIPPTNPFVGVEGDDEIWSYGVRNPWRASFDRVTGDFYFGDVGMDSWEEINGEPADSVGGRNYGWPCTEGTHCTPNTRCVCNGPGLTPPLLDIAHPPGHSITGGYVYRGDEVPELRGAYIFADFIGMKVWSCRPDLATGRVTEFVDRSADFTPAGETTPLRFVASMGEDLAGELYFGDMVNGRVYKLEKYPCGPVVDRAPDSQVVPQGAPIRLTVAAAGSEPLTFRWRKNGENLADGGRITGAATAALTISDAQPDDQGTYDVLLSNSCGDATSESAEITVQACWSADVNHSGDITLQDIFDFLTAFFSGPPAGDFNHSGEVSVQDVFDFLFAYFSGCR